MTRPSVPDVVYLISNAVAVANREIKGMFAVHAITSVPSYNIETDKSLSVWIFHNTEYDKAEMRARRPEIQATIADILLRNAVPDDIVKKIGWCYDSDENVQKLSNGDYFAHMR